MVYVIGLGDNKVDYYSNKNIKFPGGNAINFSVVAKRMGLNSYYIGTISNDSDGELVLQSLKEEGINTDFIDRSDDPEEKVFVKIVNGDRHFIKSSRNKRQLPNLTQQIIDLSVNSLLVHSGCHSNSISILKTLHEAGATTSFDFSELPKYHTYDYLKKLGQSVDIAQFSLSDTTEKGTEQILNNCKKIGIKYVLTTNGSKNPVFYDFLHNKKYIGNVKYVSSPIDTMGAGDTYFASFAINLVNALQKGKVNSQIMSEIFEKAADISAKEIMNQGSFGYGKGIE